MTTTAPKVETVSGVPIVGYCRVQGTDECIPMIETETDIQWVKGCIRDREEHPEYYPDEDVPAVIAQQKAQMCIRDSWPTAAGRFLLPRHTRI